MFLGINIHKELIEIPSICIQRGCQSETRFDTPFAIEGGSSAYQHIITQLGAIPVNDAKMGQSVWILPCTQGRYTTTDGTNQEKRFFWNGIADIELLAIASGLKI